MTKTGKGLTALLLAVVMAIACMPILGAQKAYAADEPAAIEDTYELDGVTYFNAKSDNFAVDKVKFYRDLLGTPSSNLLSERGYFNEDWDQGDYGWVYYDQSESSLWLQLGASLLTDLAPDALYNQSRPLKLLYNAAVMGSDSYDQGNGITYQATRYDPEGKYSPKEAEQWVFQKTFGSNKDFGYFTDDTLNQPTLAAAVNVQENYNGQVSSSYTIAAYFTNFRVFALIPSDEGSNYVTELISDTVNSQSTTASTVKNLTASTITGSQSITNSITTSVSNSVNGSESHSTSKSEKIGASYKFTESFSVSGEVSWTESEAFSTGWGTSDSISKSKNASYSVSVPLAPYTQAMITQSDTTSVYVTRYNCPIALLYDVTVVAYETGQARNGIMHIKYTQPAVDKDAVWTFADPMSGARADLDSRVKSCENWSSMDEQQVRWYYILNNSPEQYELRTIPEAIEALRNHVPMASTGAAYTQTLNVVSSEVTGLMPTHPLYRVKIAEPSVNIHSDEVSYRLFDYFTAKMKVGDYSYANYMSLVGFNRNDVPFYGFSKDNGYWVITDKEGNELDPEESPVLLEKDKVSTNWRYTAVKPGTCYMVYRIDEDVYYIANNPDKPIKNEDLVKTAALEIIVTEKDFTGTIEVTGSYSGFVDDKPKALDEEGKLYASVCDEEGVEIDADVTWQKKEKNGITLDGNMVSFTKPGTYHVRAKANGRKSDWVAVTAKIKPASISTLTKASKGFTAKWKKINGADGYELQYALNSKFSSEKKTVKIKKGDTVSQKITKLKANKKYYVRIRTFKKVGSATYYSAWSKSKTVTTGK